MIDKTLLLILYECDNYSPEAGSVLETTHPLSQHTLRISLALQFLKLGVILVSSRDVLIIHSIIHKQRKILIRRSSIPLSPLRKLILNPSRQVLGELANSIVVTLLNPSALDLKKDAVWVVGSEADGVSAAFFGVFADCGGEGLEVDGALGSKTAEVLEVGACDVDELVGNFGIYA